MQRRRHVPDGPPPRLEDFFDDRADEFIDELIRIIFTRNMKSMERYHLWVSREHALKSGRLHRGLVDAVFKYNNGGRKGPYMATLGGLRPLEEI